MTFLTLTEKEYYNFWKNHPQKTFLSSIEIGKLREKSNWKVHYLGLKKKKKVVAAAMLLSRKKSFNQQEFYSPRGFLIDYNDQELVEQFTYEVKKYVKKNNGYSLRIDPYIINKQRDINGKIVENGIDNTHIVNHLEKLGFKKLAIKDTEQVTWMFSLDLEGKSEEQIFNEMRPNTRNIIRKAEKFGIKIKELSYEELPKFNDILKKTAKRRSFKARNKDYYEEMYKLFTPKNEVKYYITELNVNDYLENLNKELAEKKSKLDTKNIKASRKAEIEKDITLLSNKIEEANALKEKAVDGAITLSGSMFILIKPEVVYLSSGNYEEYLKFNSQYLLQWELIKYGIKNGFKKHNFYGIPENIDKHPDNYGIYEFKKGFNGYVEELIGEYELPINTYYYVFKFINKIKEIKYALHI